MLITNAKSKIVGFVAALALTAAATITTPAAADNLYRWIDVENLGSSDIVSIRISHIDNPDWSRNLIRGNYIEAGGVMTVEPGRTDGYCRFDMLISYSDGEEVKVWDINLCEETDIAFDEEGYYFI